MLWLSKSPAGIFGQFLGISQSHPGHFLGSLLCYFRSVRRRAFFGTSGHFREVTGQCSVDSRAFYKQFQDSFPSQSPTVLVRFTDIFQSASGYTPGTWRAFSRHSLSRPRKITGSVLLSNRTLFRHLASISQVVPKLQNDSCYDPHTLTSLSCGSQLYRLLDHRERHRMRASDCRR